MPSARRDLRTRTRAPLKIDGESSAAAIRYVKKAAERAARSGGAMHASEGCE
jgi:hypothetical protein